MICKTWDISPEVVFIHSHNIRRLKSLCYRNNYGINIIDTGICIPIQQINGAPIIGRCHFFKLKREAFDDVFQTLSKTLNALRVRCVLAVPVQFEMKNLN